MADWSRDALGSVQPGGAPSVVWVAEAALGRLRKFVPSGGLVDDGDGFVFMIEDAAELTQILAELTQSAAFGVAEVVDEGGRALVRAVADARCQGRQKLRRGPDRTPRMGAIASPIVTIADAATGEEARQRFLADEMLTSLAYVDAQGRPRASLGREKLLRMFSGRYGYAVYSGRPVVEAVDADPRLVSAETTIVEAASMIAASEEESLYDDVIVTDPGGRAMGTVRVRDLLRALTSLGLERIQALNYLTGLPGPVRTEQALLEMLDRAEPLVVSRVDIVDFKAFNERSGFAAGDRTLQALGHAVAAVARTRGVRFVGHIGGDDFVVAWNSEDEAVAGAIEIASGLVSGIDDLGLPDGVATPELAVSTLVVEAGAIRDVALLAEKLAEVKSSVRRRGGAVHAMARLDRIADPTWRPLDSGYVRAAGHLASVLR